MLPEPCAHRACTVRPFAYSVSTTSTMPESELPWLVAGLPVYYHRSNGEKVSATVLAYPVLRPQENHPGHVNRGAMPLETDTAYVGSDFVDSVADEIEISVTQPVLSLVLSPVHGLLRRCMQGAEIGSLEPVTSIRFKKKKSRYANRGCRVQKIGPWNL